MAFNQFQIYIELCQVHRQNCNEIGYKKLLQNLSCGLIDNEDFVLLNSRRLEILSPEEKSKFEDAIYLLPTNELVNQYNKKYLRNSQCPVATILAVNNPDIKFSSSDETNIGLQNELYITVNCRVMLRRNLWVKGGLVNGNKT